LKILENGHLGRRKIENPGRRQSALVAAEEEKSQQAAKNNKQSQIQQSHFTDNIHTKLI